MGVKLITTLIIICGLVSCNPKETSNNSSQANKWFVAEFYPLCDDSRGVFLDMDKLNKYGKYNPYDTVELVNKDSVIISFDFITDCCLTFSGDVDLHQDTLFLKYGFSGDSLISCDCYCDYRMTYKIDIRERYWKAMKILRE